MIIVVLPELPKFLNQEVNYPKADHEEENPGEVALVEAAQFGAAGGVHC